MASFRDRHHDREAGIGGSAIQEVANHVVVVTGSDLQEAITEVVVTDIGDTALTDGVEEIGMRCVGVSQSDILHHSVDGGVVTENEFPVMSDALEHTQQTIESDTRSVFLVQSREEIAGYTRLSRDSEIANDALILTVLDETLLEVLDDFFVAFTGYKELEAAYFQMQLRCLVDGDQHPANGFEAETAPDVICDAAHDVDGGRGDACLVSDRGRRTIHDEWLDLNTEVCQFAVQCDSVKLIAHTVFL